jgi:hypothetical protein
VCFHSDDDRPVDLDGDATLAHDEDDRRLRRRTRRRRTPMGLLTRRGRRRSLLAAAMCLGLLGVPEEEQDGDEEPRAAADQRDTADATEATSTVTEGRTVRVTPERNRAAMKDVTMGRMRVILEAGGVVCPAGISVLPQLDGSCTRSRNIASSDGDAVQGDQVRLRAAEASVGKEHATHASKRHLDQEDAAVPDVEAVRVIERVVSDACDEEVHAPIDGEKPLHAA